MDVNKNPETNILNWNANGIKRQENQLRHFIASHNIKIACISETHLLPQIKFSIPGFNIYRNDRLSATAAGGVAILVHKDIKHTLINSPTSNDLETIAITTKINNKDTTIISAYKPPNKLFPRKIYTEIFGNNDNIMLIGDLNSKHCGWGCNTTTPQGQNLLNLATTLNLSIMAPIEPTHYPYNNNIIPDILDILITKNIDFPLYQKVIPELDSDHNPIIISFHPLYLSSYYKQQKGKINWFKFREILKINYKHPQNIQSEKDLDNEVKRLVSNIQGSLTNSTTYLKITNPIYKQQIPIKIINLIKSKHNLRRYWQMTRRPDLKRKLNKLTRLVKTKLDQHRYASFQTFLKEIHPSSRHMWSTIHRIKRQKQEFPQLKLGSQVANSDFEKTSLIADYLEKSFNPNPVENDHFNKQVEEFNQKPLYTAPVNIKYISPSEIKQEIKKSKTKKSAGYDFISNKVLKELNNNSIAGITAIFNAALRIGYFPNDWKIATVLPFRKAEKNPKDPANYRPISLLPSLSKLLEKLILKRLIKFMTNTHVIPDTQFGFRPNHSTTHQILRLTEYIAQGFHAKQHTIAIFLDITKAFDKIWHQGLLYKLRQIGTPDYLFQIIKSFLNQRKFQVKINDAISSLRQISAGLPQGSPLSPVLFNLYISDYPHLIDSQIALYADDTALFSKHGDIMTARNNLQDDLDIFNKWAKNWRIKMNPYKTQAKIFTLRHPHTPPQLILNNENIPWAANNTAAKYLGMQLDTKLNWKTHIYTTRTKTQAKLSQLYALINKKSSLKIETGMIIYKSIIRPTMTYACPIWGNAAKSNINLLQTIQNKALRTIIKAPWFISNKQIHHELQIPTIKEHITKLSEDFFTSLPSSPSTSIFNLGRTAEPNLRINSRFPKDRFRPP